MRLYEEISRYQNRELDMPEVERRPYWILKLSEVVEPQSTNYILFVNAFDAMAYFQKLTGNSCPIKASLMKV